ncbi:MAG TPA: LUD domain-containing protein [Jatrophihabitans sp.]|nr:LUD domain-containing protein [Jatrophihabitans sp.]
MTARDEILARIRTALDDRPAPPPVPRDYRTDHGAGDPDLFAERVSDYRATVHRDATVDAVITDRGITRIVVPDGFPDDWLPKIELVREPVGIDTLDDVDAVLTTCRLAIAETGTIVLDHGPGQGPRALTLVPDYHLVVVRTDQIVAAVPDALAQLDPTRPQTWISGPSATSDIELDRVEGVHGPRTLDVLIV